jgi:hypothetical protein
MTKFLKTDSDVRIIKDANIRVSDELRPGAYLIKKFPMSEELYLSEIEPFKIPKKVYGNAEWLTERILNTYSQRSGSTGVLLTGEKGSGKTMLSKMLSHKSGLPVIIVDAEWHGTSFNDFLYSIKQKCVILFDEFDKNYAYDKQEKVLSLLDGVFDGQKLFIVTANKTSHLTGYVTNRPGRFFYHVEYESIENDLIEEFCKDKNISDEIIIELKDLAYSFSGFNFDMLSAVVEEYQRYGGEISEVVKYLNVSPPLKYSRSNFTVEIFRADGSAIKLDKTIYNEDPITLKEGFYAMPKGEEGGPDEEVYFYINNLVKFDSLTKTRWFETREGVKLTVREKEIVRKFN